MSLIASPSSPEARPAGWNFRAGPRAAAIREVEALAHQVSGGRGWIGKLSGGLA